MSITNIPSLRSEDEDLRKVNSMLLDTFTQCEELKSDILQYSSDPRKDLQEFKEKLVDLSKIQKNVSALIRTTQTIEYEIQDKEENGEVNFNTISNTFNDSFVSALNEQSIDEEAEKIISAVDAYISGRNTGVNRGNEELLVTGTKESYLDPLTKLPIQDPVKSKTCHHSFERSSILEFLKKHKRCPYSGCVNNLRKEDLVEDLALKRQLLNIRMNQNQ